MEQYRNRRTILGEPAVAYSVGLDAGNRSMRRAGRDRWNHEDWNAAVQAFRKVSPAPEREGEPWNS